MSGNRERALGIVKRSIHSAADRTEAQRGKDLQVTQKVRSRAGAAPKVSPPSPRDTGLIHLFLPKKGFSLGLRTRGSFRRDLRNMKSVLRRA